MLSKLKIYFTPFANWRIQFWRLIKLGDMLLAAIGLQTASNSTNQRTTPTNPLSKPGQDSLLSVDIPVERCPGAMHFSASLHCTALSFYILHTTG